MMSFQNIHTLPWLMFMFLPHEKRSKIFYHIQTIAERNHFQFNIQAVEAHRLLWIKAFIKIDPFHETFLCIKIIKVIFHTKSSNVLNSLMK